MATTNKKASVRKSTVRPSSKSSSRPASRVGGSSLARSSKSSLFTKRNGLIAAALAAVAGLAFVAFSFASGVPPYQYSYNDVCTPKATTNSTTTSTTQTDTQKQTDQQTCYNDSAQGMTYRLYTGLLGRNPDAGGYQYWTQQFAGERVRPTQSLLVLNAVKAPADDKAFVAALYKNGLMRTEANIAKDKSGVDYWVKKLSGEKKWSRARVAVTILNSKEAKRANALRFNNFLATAPTVKVTQTAAAEQKKRYEAMAAYAKAQKVNADAAGKNALNAQNALNAAKASAGGSPDRSRLEAIASNQRAAESEYNKAATRARATENAKKAASRLRDRAADLAKYATDIKEAKDYGLTKIDANYALIKAYDKNADKAAADARQRISDIAEQYKIAEGKYETEQNRIAAEQPAPQQTVAAAAAGVAAAQALVDAAKTEAEKKAAQERLAAALKAQQQAAAAVAAAAAVLAGKICPNTTIYTTRKVLTLEIQFKEVWSQKKSLFWGKCIKNKLISSSPVPKINIPKITFPNIF